jgi:hypothetical protein
VDQQHEADPENTPQHPPIYITDLTSISSLIQLLEPIAKQQYEIKALADNQVKFQSKTSESCKTIIKASVGKQGIPLLQIKRQKLQSRVKIYQNRI